MNNHFSKTNQLFEFRNLICTTGNDLQEQGFFVFFVLVLFNNYFLLQETPSR